MNLTPGTKLGPYKILSPIGAGGMGEVWKAQDTRLGRIVAQSKPSTKSTCNALSTLFFISSENNGPRLSLLAGFEVTIEDGPKSRRTQNNAQ